MGPKRPTFYKKAYLGRQKGTYRSQRQERTGKADKYIYSSQRQEINGQTDRYSIARDRRKLDRQTGIM
jgi:hypothetical protein